MHYLIVLIEFINRNTNSQTPFLVAGHSSLAVCSFHIDNGKAVEPDVATAACKTMMADCLKWKVMYASGDANQAWPRGYLAKGLEQAKAEYKASKKERTVYARFQERMKKEK